MTDPLAEIKTRRVAREDWFVRREPPRWYDDGSCRYCGKDQAGRGQDTGDFHEDDCPAASEPGPDIDMLIGVLEDARRLISEWGCTAEIERLRGLLGRLEWAHDAYEGSGGGACPVCYGGGVHSPDCWLAKELHPNESDPPLLR